MPSAKSSNNDKLTCISSNVNKVYMTYWYNRQEGTAINNNSVRHIKMQLIQLIMRKLLLWDIGLQLYVAWQVEFIDPLKSHQEWGIGANMYKMNSWVRTLNVLFITFILVYWLKKHTLEFKPVPRTYHALIIPQKKHAKPSHAICHTRTHIFRQFKNAHNSLKHIEITVKIQGR